MATPLDLSGQVFGRLTALRVEHRNGRRGWVCRCECGNETWVQGAKLKNGHTQSCGCFQKETAAHTRTESALDLTNTKFGKLTALYSEYRNNRRGWVCKCECGEQRWAQTGQLKSGNVRSCGCTKLKKRPASDLTGKKFARLTVLRLEHKNGKCGWACRCECGKETWAQTADLTKGRMASCGCFRSERARTHNTKHGHCKGLRSSRTYTIWLGMRDRCTRSNNAAYFRYGGDGIQVCSEWLNSFDAFLRDMGEAPPGLTLERSNNDFDYAPDNCRWATRTEQANNTRRNHKITAFGKTQTLAEWSKETGLGYGTLCSRLNKLKWLPERALTEPVNGKAA